MTEQEISQLLTPKRLARLKEVIGRRTRQITVGLESIHKGHNQSAILRSCDAFGIQDVHIIESTGTPFRPNSEISIGAEKWLDLHFYENPQQMLQHLHEQGYQVWASSFHEEAVDISQIDLTQRVALLFGSERFGISQELENAADGRFIIPMQGFSQSFNVSVAVAISLYEAVRQRMEKFGSNGDLSDEEKEALLQRFISISLPSRLRHAIEND